MLGRPTLLAVSLNRNDAFSSGRTSRKKNVMSPLKFTEVEVNCTLPKQCGDLNMTIVKDTQSASVRCNNTASARSDTDVSFNPS